MLIPVNGEITGAGFSQVEIINPANGELIDTVPDIDQNTADLAVKAAAEGLREWSGMSQEQRNKIIYRFIELYEKDRHEIARLLSRETGKMVREAEGEIDVCSNVTRGYCEMAAHLYGNCLPGGSTAGMDNGDIVFTRREPLGVMLIILPFNYPVDLFSQKVMSALIAGNSVIVKPPCDNPLAILTMISYLHQAGVPAKAVQAVTGADNEVSRYLVGHSGISAVSMTGSTAAGIDIYQNAAKNLTRVFLELGGNDAFLVAEDGDIDLAASEAVGSRLGNAGQICCASKRFLVHEAVVEEFTEKLIGVLKLVKTGDPEDPENDMGCLISEKAAQKADAAVERCIEQGAVCLLGGKHYGRAFFPPTVLGNVTGDMDVAKDMEIFAPVFPIISVRNMEEAVLIANQSCYGLSGAVFSRDMARAISIAARLETAGIVINGGSAYRTPDLAFGGYKKSGIGREGISRTLEELTQEKNYILKAVLNQEGIR